MAKPFDTRQSANRAYLRKLANIASFDSNSFSRLDRLLAALNAEVSPAFEMYPNDPSNRVLNIGSNLVTNPETSIRHSNSPINKQFPTFASGTITLPAASGGSVVVSPTITPNPVLTISANGYIKALIECDTLGNLSVTLGQEGASETLATFPGINSKAFQVGLLVIHAIAGVVQNVTGSTLIQFQGGGGSGASGSGSGVIEPIPGYSWLEQDTFDVLSTSVDSKITAAGYTNAVQNLGKDLYKILCDKSKTVNTSSGTGLTISPSGPSFTVVAGDIAYLTSGARSGQWRRIATVNSQTNFTLDAAFTGGNASPGDTLMISQAVWSKDLVNLGSASDKTRARDQFSGNISQIAIDYLDSLTTDDDIPDFVDAARVVVSASNFGLVSDSGVPTSDTFAAPFVRQPYPDQINDYTLNANSASSSTLADNTSPDSSTQAIQANGNPHQAIAQPISLASGADITAIRTIVTKTGLPVGNINVSIVKDNGSGFPSTTPADVVGSTSFSVSSLPAGVSTVDISGLDIQFAAGEAYHIVFEGDASYKASFVAISKQVDIHANTSVSFSVGSMYDGTTWSSLGSPRLLFRLTGVADQAARLFLAFFCNPNNANVTSFANLLSYEASFYADGSVENGGSLDSAYCYTDGTGTPINCSVSTPAGFTEIQLDWSYVAGVNPGQTAGQLRVYVDGEEIPRFVAGSTLDAYYTEVSGAYGSFTIVRLHTDLSALNRSVEIIRSEGVVDTSNTNSSSIAYLLEDKNVRTVSSSYLIASSDSLILVDADSAPLTVTLPSAVGLSGKRFTIKKVGGTGNIITIQMTGSETLDGSGNATPFRINAVNDATTVESDGANWNIVDKHLSRQHSGLFIGSNQTISNATLTKVDFTTANLINDAGIANTTTDQIVIKYAGYYLVSGNLTYQLNGAGTRYMFVRVNGNDIWGSSTPGEGSFKARLSFTSYMFFNQGDVLEMYTWQNSSGSLILDSVSPLSNNLTVMRVGDSSANSN